MTDTPTQVPELLPCPFCGSAARWATDATEWEIHCSNQDCGILLYSCGATGEETKRNWNTRAPDERIAQADARNEALVEALGNVRQRVCEILSRLSIGQVQGAMSLGGITLTEIDEIRAAIAAQKE